LAEQEGSDEGDNEGIRDAEREATTAPGTFDPDGGGKDEVGDSPREAERLGNGVKHSRESRGRERGSVRVKSRLSGRTVGRQRGLFHDGTGGRVSE
jgi:hypothetical protein